MSRQQKSAHNAVINIAFFAINIIMAFFSRKIFLENLGIPFIGLSATLQNFIGFLNLAELGITTAIAVILYKPILSNDKTAINEIITLLKIYYKRIGIILLICGIFLSLFFYKIFEKSEIPIEQIYLGYFAFLTSSLLGYFNNYKQVLLTADQRNYEIVKIYNSFFILKTILQIITTIYFKSIVMWFLFEYIMGISYTLALNRRIKKIYPWLSLNFDLSSIELVKKYPELKKMIKNLFIHKISGFIAQQSSQLIIFGILNITTVAFYNNYLLIISKAQSLVNNFLGISMSASVGNLVAEGDKIKTLNVFWELYSLRFLFGSITAFLLLIHTTPFISVWLGSKYTLSQSVIIFMILNSFVMIIRTTVDDFISAHGLFNDIWAPITEMILNIILSISFGLIWGLSGILCAFIISMFFIVLLWKPYFLFKYGMKERIRHYYFTFIKYIIIIVLSMFISYQIGSYFLSTPLTDYKNIIISLTIHLFIYILIHSINMLLFTTEYKRMISRLYIILKKIINTKKTNFFSDGL
ncbi:MAG: sugar transporter [Bacteroidales bacterium]|nr:sugar transporter [Bacteroidales bacterium]